MMTVVLENSHVIDLEAALLPYAWEGGVSPAQYLEAVIQEQGHSVDGSSRSHDQGLAQNMEVTQSLKATRFRKIGKLKLEATDHMNDHLKLDIKRGVVKMFRHTAFLKEQLLASRTAYTNTSLALFEE